MTTKPLTTHQRTALVTDSNAQLPEQMAARLGVGVVPISVVVDGTSHREGVDLDVDDFYAALAAGAEVSTSQPSPGEFLEAYRAAASAGAEHIVSIHVGSELSGTLNSARLAAESAPVAVHLVDTGQMSFSVGACVLAAATARDRGGSVPDVVGAAEKAGTRLANVFVVEGLDLARRSGRASIDAVTDEQGIPVLSVVGTRLDVLGHATDVEEAVALMAVPIRAAVGPITVAIGYGDSGAAPTAAGLRAAAEPLGHVTSLIDYRCGPSVGAFSGAGVAGAVYWPD